MRPPFPLGQGVRLTRRRVPRCAVSRWRSFCMRTLYAQRLRRRARRLLPLPRTPVSTYFWGVATLPYLRETFRGRRANVVRLTNRKKPTKGNKSTRFVRLFIIIVLSPQFLFGFPAFQLATASVLRIIRLCKQTSVFFPHLFSLTYANRLFPGCVQRAFSCILG